MCVLILDMCTAEVTLRTIFSFYAIPGQFDMGLKGLISFKNGYFTSISKYDGSVRATWNWFFSVETSKPYEQVEKNTDLVKLIEDIFPRVL